MLSLAILKKKFGREFHGGKIVFSLKQVIKMVDLFQHFS